MHGYVDLPNSKLRALKRVVSIRSSANITYYPVTSSNSM